MKEQYKALWAILTFVLLQGFGGVVLALLFPALPPVAMGLTVIITGLLSVGIIYWMGCIDKHSVWDVHRIHWRMVPLAIAGAFSGIFASDFLCELLNLPDLMSDQFQGMAQSFWGILSMAIVAPVVEELVFREAVLGHLLRKGVQPWAAIISSALAFGVVHGNPVQIPFATIVGVLLAIIYYKTGNIVVPVIVHILNNSMAVVEMNLLGDQAETFRYADIWGSTGTLIATILCTAVCIFLMRMFWKRYPAKR